ncbi:MAG: type II toxin-antitoxin system HicA family toxin [Burkholderiaceae bacterium]|nr:type II toxin-antitoxin system HicA family toxin [Burkholderiaceae bacterium]
MGSHLYNKLRDILLSNGCYFHRQGKGSHEIWKNPTIGAVFPVATHIPSRHTANAILKQAGIKQKM